MLLRRTLLYLPAQIVGPLFQLISVVVWTHVADERALGVITLVTAMHELLQAAFLFWWSQYALRFFGAVSDPQELDRFYRTENAVLLLSVVIQSIVALVILNYTIAPGGRLLLSLGVVGYVITRSYNLYLAERARARHEVIVYSIQQVTGPALGFLIGLVLIKTFGGGPEWPIAGYAIAQFIGFAAALPLIRFGRAVGPIDRTILKQALRYGAPLVVSGGFSWLTINASRFIVSHMLGLAAAGLFAVGYGLGFRASTVAAMMVTASAFPLAVRTMEERGVKRAMRQLGDNGALLAAILLPSIGGIFILRDEIVRLLIAPSFQAATLAILPLAVLAGGLRNFRAHFADQVFLLHRRTGLMTAVSGIEALLTVALSIPLIAMWGLTGAVVASVASAATAAVLSFVVGMAAFGLRPPVKHLAKSFFATGVMMAALAFVPRHVHASALALHIAAGAAIYLAVLAVLYGNTLKALWLRRAKLA